MVLRLFYVSHRLKQKKYETKLEYADFPSDVSPEAAYAELLTKRGSVLSGDQTVETLLGQRIKVAPDQYITINSHALVDEKRKQVILPSEKYQEQALPMDFKACLKDSPKMAAKRKHKTKGMAE